MAAGWVTRFQHKERNNWERRRPACRVAIDIGGPLDFFKRAKEVSRNDVITAFAVIRAFGAMQAGRLRSQLSRILSRIEVVLPGEESVLQ